MCRRAVYGMFHEAKPRMNASVLTQQRVAGLGQREEKNCGIYS